jgi:hypothetical protein
MIDPRKIEITNKAHLEHLIFEIEGAFNKDRKAEAFKLHECIEDNQRQFVKNELARIYPDTFQYFRIGDINISGKIIQKKAKAYKTIPTRSLNTEKETALYTDLLESFKADRAFKEFDRIYNANKYAAFWVNYVNPVDTNDPLAEGTYTFQALAPYEYDLLRDPMTGAPLIFCLHYPDTTITGGEDGIEQLITESQKDTAAESKLYVFWDKNNKVKVRRIIPAINGVLDISASKLEIVEIVENDIRRLPIAFLSKDLAVDYPLPSQLANKSIDFNVAYSDLKTAASAQGHGQLVIKYPTGQKIDKPHLGKHTAILLPQSSKDKDAPTEASYINASPDLMGQLEVLKFDLSQILDDEGIKAKSSLQGGESFSSGFDRLLSEADVQDIIEDNQTLYTEIENEVYEIVKAYETALNKNTFRSEKLSVTFEKPKVMISDKETLENIEKRDQLGLIKSYEKHLIINPNLSEKEAINREEEIKVEKAAQVALMQQTFSDNANDNNFDDNNGDDLPMEEV